MPTPIVGGLIQYLNQQLATTVWDGEVPRLAPNGQPISPSNPGTWPVIKVFMPESGFDVSWTFENPYSEQGEILIQTWGTSRSQAEATMTQIFNLFANENNWQNVVLGGPISNPFRLIQMLLRNWCSLQEGSRTANSEYLYRCDLHYTATVHAVVTTF